MPWTIEYSETALAQLRKLDKPAARRLVLDLAVCDRLEAGLATADTTRRRLLESLLREALDESA